MTHLIDKAAVIAEIERRKYQFVSQAEAFHGIGKEDKESYFAALASNMNSLLSFIDTLEVKEEVLDRNDKTKLMRKCVKTAYKRGYDMGVLQTTNKINHNTKEVEEEPVSEDLGEAANTYVDNWYKLNNLDKESYPIDVEISKNDFKAGAKWQKEQMEKNRIAHCDNITEEQYNLETGFLDDFLDKNKRMPTFLDAIEYGMKKAMEE